MTAILAFFQTKLGEYVLLGLALFALIFAFGVYERQQQREKDVAEFAQERAAQAEANRKAIAELDAKYRAQEAQQQARITEIGIDYAQKLADATDQRNKDVAAARAGALKLRIPPGNADNGSPSQAGTSSPGGDGPARGELPPETAANLLALADDADQVAKQLGACQAIIAADRAVAP